MGIHKIDCSYVSSNLEAISENGDSGADDPRPAMSGNSRT